MTEKLSFEQIKFVRFKAFNSFTLNLRKVNIMVGPNNSGKSTTLAAFRILSAGIRKANSRKPELVRSPQGRVFGYIVDLASLSIGEENIFYNYDDSEPASITFTLTGKKSILLYFPEAESCSMIIQDPEREITSPSVFKTHFRCEIGFVPILGPVEHNEGLYEKEAARLALFNYRASRNFRNIWHHYSKNFELFRKILRQTWPGMDIEKPEIDSSHEKPLLRMYCLENRITREMFWAGFGFQVWCQMLTHLVQSRSCSIFLIDEPDIYLHSDLQRQLLSLLEDLGPDILIATHSTEIISEASTEDIVLIDKNRRMAQRIQTSEQLEKVFYSLGSRLNPILTQLAKTRCVVFVEGEDFKIISRFARKVKLRELGNQSTFAVIPIGGFNPDRVRSMKTGIEATLGASVRTAVILDRDFRSDDECTSIQNHCSKFSDLVVIHKCKEIENFLLQPEAIDRAAKKRVEERARQTGKPKNYSGKTSLLLEKFAEKNKNYIMSQYTSQRRKFERQIGSKKHDATIDHLALKEFEVIWSESASRRLGLVPAKDALSAVNQYLQRKYKISVTQLGIVDAVRSTEIPDDLKKLLENLSEFTAP